jgi:hypothetical protein
VVIAPNVCFSTAVSVSGFVTKNKARAQVVIINALSKAFVRMNRRAHDKIIVVDGHAADKAKHMSVFPVPFLFLLYSPL